MTAMTGATGGQRTRGLIFGAFLHRFGTLGIFVVLVVAAAFWSPSFLTRPNLLNVLRQVASSAGIMAVGMLYVILTRGIDLSVGSIAALGSVLSAYFIAFSGFSVPVSILLVILSGAACGVVTGSFVAYLKLPSFVMSLAMMAIARGLSLIFSAGRPIPLGDGGDALADFGSGLLVRPAPTRDPDVRDLHRRRDRSQLHEFWTHHHRRSARTRRRYASPAFRCRATFSRST